MLTDLNDPKTVVYFEQRLGGKTSLFGRTVAKILDDIWALYNIPQQIKKSDFSSEHHIEVRWDHDLSTFDSDALTELVVRCHDACVRLSIQPCNARYVRLLFHPRKREATRFSQRHPTMEEAVVAVRARNYFFGGTA